MSGEGRHDYDVDVADCSVFLMGYEGYASGDGLGDCQEPGVEYVMANRFIRNMDLLRRTDPNKDVLIHMKTNGGYWEEGMAIYDRIRAHPCLVTVLNYTHARSMSSLIFLAANKRVMMPHSTFMFHEGTLGMDGTYKSFQSFAEFEKRVARPAMLGIYTRALKEQGKFARRNEAWIWGMLEECMNQKEEVYLTAEEAVEWGFADEVFDGRWDKLRVYTDKQKERE